MTIFKTKHVLSTPDVGSNPSDQSFWWDVYDAIHDSEHTHIRDGDNTLFKITGNDLNIVKETQDDTKKENT